MPKPEISEWITSSIAGYHPGEAPEPQPLAGSGSDRRLTRLFPPGGSLILVENPCSLRPEPNENDSFVYLAGHLRDSGFPVPEIYAYHRELGVYLMEDLGDDDLFGRVRSVVSEEELAELYREGVSLLARLQSGALKGFDPGRCHSPERYDRTLMLNGESGYFHRELLAAALDLPILSAGLAAEFARLADRASEAGADFFLHRDFQSMNLKLHHGRLWIIDFQGARLGPPQYDLAGLLLDPYVELPGEFRREMMEEYLRHFLPRTGIDRGRFLEAFTPVAAHRLMQALGAYGYLGLTRGKREFLAFVPAGLRLLGEVCRLLPPGEFPELLGVIDLALDRWEKRGGVACAP